MPASTLLRVSVSSLVIASAAFTGSLVAATPASALSVCASAEPPDWCFAPPAPPSAPSGLRATAILQTSVTLVWNQVGTLPLTLTRTVAGFTTTIKPAAGSTSYIDTAAPAGTSITYTLVATACNKYGCTDGDPPTLTVTTHPLGTNPVGSASGSVPAYYNSPPSLDDRIYYAMTGWALDYDTTSPISVQLLSDGQPYGSPITASGASSTNATSPGYGDAHGFARPGCARPPARATTPRALSRSTSPAGPTPPSAASPTTYPAHPPPPPTSNPSPAPPR